MPTPPTLIKLCFAVKQCKCVNLNSVPEYDQSYSDCLHVQLLTNLPNIYLFIWRKQKKECCTDEEFGLNA